MERRFRVTEANEEAGFARCASEDTAHAFHCELYIPDPDAHDLVRLHVGDLIAGSLRGASIVDARFLERASPPPSLVASLAALAGELAPHGLSLPGPIERLADSVWRFNRRQPDHSVTGTVEGIVSAQLTFLFDRSDHPFDDRTLIQRLVAAMRRHNVLIDIAERVDENGDVQGFQILPDGPFLPFGDDGDWEQPAGCYAPLIEFANAALAGGGKAARWHKVAANFLLADPSLLDLLVTHQIVERST